MEDYAILVIIFLMAVCLMILTTASFSGVWSEMIVALFGIFLPTNFSLLITASNVIVDFSESSG